LHGETEAAKIIWGTGEGSLKADRRYSKVLIDSKGDEKIEKWLHGSDDEPGNPNSQALCTVSEWSAWPDTCPCCEAAASKTLSRASAVSSSALSAVSQALSVISRADAFAKDRIGEPISNACNRTRNLIILVPGTSPEDCMGYLDANEPNIAVDGLSQSRLCGNECDASPAPVPAPPAPSPPPSGAFVFSKKGKNQSCDRTCAEMNSTCVPERMAAIRDVATLQAAMAEAGGPACSSFTAGKNVNRKKGVPGYRINKRSGKVICFASGDSLGVATSCGKNISNVFSLCYCE